MAILDIPENIPAHILLQLDDLVASVSETNVLIQTLAWCAPYLEGTVTPRHEGEEQ